MTARSPALILWSVPRSRSTAFERMMYERGDHVIVHEPFSRVCDFGDSTVAHHTCRTQTDVMDAIDELAETESVFIKDTLDFRFDHVLDCPAFLRNHRHALMIRDPEQAILSHLRMDPAVTAGSIGYARLAELARRIAEVTGTYPYVVDAEALMADPDATVRAYCAAMQICHEADALTFRRDPPTLWRGTDTWHAAASNTTELGAQQPPQASEEHPSVARVAELVAGCSPAYDEIRVHLKTQEQRMANVTTRMRGASR